MAETIGGLVSCFWRENFMWARMFDGASPIDPFARCSPSRGLLLYTDEPEIFLGATFRRVLMNNNEETSHAYKDNACAGMPAWAHKVASDSNPQAEDASQK
ncbi:hypothetical protein KM043_012843 [Ampulex compressa]|nr:hypothetical protein KM043_012843 [Ampulex compressa]